MTGRLVVSIGPMFSKKTTSLLNHASNMASYGEVYGEDYILIKPAMDDRYANDEVVSHDGVRLPCLSTHCLPTIPKDMSVVMVDEVQFFGMEIVPWVADLLSRDIDVHAAGLDMDWKGDAFIVTGVLAAMADKVTKNVARCTICGSKAGKTFKKNGQGGSVELGSSDKYEPRCNDHWSRPETVCKTRGDVAEGAESKVSLDR